MMVRGYCTKKDEAAFLRMLGLPSNYVYRGWVVGETLAACLNAFRGRHGMLLLPNGFRPIRQKKIRTVHYSVPDIVRALIEAKTLRRLMAAIPE